MSINTINTKQPRKAGRKAEVLAVFTMLVLAVTTATGQTSFTPTQTSTTTATATKRIEGQVFIVTNSGTAVKLALVQVLAIPLAQMQRYLAEIEPEVMGERAKADTFASQAKATVRQANKVAAPGPDGNSLRIWMTQHPVQAEGGGHQEWLKWRAARERAAKVAARLDEAQLARHVMYTAAPYFTKLPEPVAITKTDADGKFSLTVPSGDEYVLASRAKRSLPGGGSEHYFWVVKPQGLTVMLSNDNLTSAGSPESVLTTTE
jgi:hypothetical protein